MRYLIDLLLSQGVSSSKVSCIEVSGQQWRSLEELSFYFSDIRDLGNIDYECQEIFQRWYQDKMKE